MISGILATPFLGQLIEEYFRNILLASIFVALVAGWFFLSRLPNRFRSAIAWNWPSTDGRIETTKVRGFGSQALAELGYSYHVEGVRYSGYCSQQFGDEQQAWDYLNGLHGKPVVVRYVRRKPQISTLRNADQQSYVKLDGSSLPITFLTALSSFVREAFPSRRS